MKNLFTYQSLFKGIICTLLIGQICTNTVAYYKWGFDSQQEHIEYSGSSDNESEKKENKQEDKFLVDLFLPEFKAISAKECIWPAESFQSLHHPEIITPPPKRHLSLRHTPGTQA